MNLNWSGLYFPQSETILVVDMLRSLLTQQGYLSYDPFAGGTGTPPGLTHMVRLFVAPPQAGWVRVLGRFPENLLPELGENNRHPLLYGWLSDSDGGFAAVDAEGRQTDPEAFAPYLRADRSQDDLRRAFAGDLPVPDVANNGPPVAAVGGETLPPELRDLAEERGVDPGKANKLFERLSGGLFGKLGKQADDDVSAEQQQARAIFAGGGKDHWNSLAGQRVRAIASVLDLPSNWRVPDWDTVREAYQTHRLHQRNPRMPLMPGDQEALDNVSNALDYIPVYMGLK